MFAGAPGAAEAGVRGWRGVGSSTAESEPPCQRDDGGKTVDWAVDVPQLFSRSEALAVAMTTATTTTTVCSRCSDTAAATRLLNSHSHTARHAQPPGGGALRFITLAGYDVTIPRREWIRRRWR